MTVRRPSWPLMIETGLALIVASAAIRLVPFRKLAERLSKPLPRSRPAPHKEIAALTWAIRAWCRRLPWRTLCFEQGLTAHWLLRRRGFSSTLHYGAAKREGILKAHVWIKSGALDVVGCEIAGDYALLARFPDETK